MWSYVKYCANFLTMLSYDIYIHSCFCKNILCTFLQYKHKTLQLKLTFSYDHPTCRPGRKRNFINQVLKYKKCSLLLIDTTLTIPVIDLLRSRSKAIRTSMQKSISISLSRMSCAAEIFRDYLHILAAV